MNPIGRIPPSSIEAEEQLLSACMQDGGETLNRCIERRFVPKTFYVPANQVIFGTLCAMLDARQPIDLSVLGEELKRIDQFEVIGGWGYLSRVSSRIATTAGASYFIEQVKGLSLRRACIVAGTQIVEDAYDLSSDLDEFVGKSEAGLLAATQERVSGDSSPAGELADGAMAEFEKCAENPGRLIGLSTGFKDIDHITGGLRPAEMIVIAGRPSCGKTSLATNWAENIAMGVRAAKPETVWMASLEMSKPQLGRRLLAQRAHVNVKFAIQGLIKKTSEEWKQMEQARAEFKRCKLFIDDESSMTVPMIGAKSRRIQGKHGLGLIIVDYMQLIKSVDPKSPREQQVAEFSRGLKALAKELNVPLVVLAQLNRASEKENRPPRLSDLRESGAIEQDADVVIMLDRPKDQGDTHQVAAPTMDCYIHKNRNGEVGDCKLTFIPHITRFENYTR
jgi:replicative DNA helicase